MIKYIIPFLLLLAVLSLNPAFASKVDTVETYSKAMKKNIKAVVITPEGYDSKNAYPVVYLLHGAGDNYAAWLKKVPDITLAADMYKIIIVCPDGNVTSWYFDSPVNKAWRYEAYITGELIPWIDEHYKTIKGKNGRGITGLSMGGHGALYLSFKHQDLFGAAGSMSGGVDIRPFPKNWRIEEKLGSYAANPDNWEQNTVTNMLNLLSPGSLSLILDCGTDDFFYKVNVNLHEKMLEKKIEHDFIIRAGKHDWKYWTNAVKYQLFFMNNFFETIQ